MRLLRKHAAVLLAVGIGCAAGLSAPALRAQTAAPPPAKTASTAAAKPSNAAKAPAKPAAKKPAAAPLVPIVWRGDQATERAFVADLAKQYEASHLGRVTMQPFSTVSGIDAVHEGSADLAGSVRPAMPGREQETDLTFYPVAWEALVPITSAKNPVDGVTLRQLYDIYLGRLKSWKDLGGADAAINLYAIAAPLDGVDFVMRKYIYDRSDQAVAVPRLLLNTAKLEDSIEIDPRGLGFTTLSAVFGKRNIKVLRVEGIAASAATIKDGSYPLYAPLYLAARKDGKHFAETQKFIEYASSEAGKAIIRKHQLVPADDAPGLADELDRNTAWVVATARGETPPRKVAAPIATADYLQRTQPTSAQTLEAKQKAAEAQAQARDKANAKNN